jgi:hypothetical protein
MVTPQSDSQATLDDLVCRGAATDVFHAEQARLLLEELDHFVDSVNQSGVGVQFFANLQGILQRELILGLTRLYEPHSKQNHGRSLPAAKHYIKANSLGLRVPQRSSLIDFLVRQGKSRSTLEPLADEALSRVLVRHLDETLPRADARSGRPLDRALDQLKTTRDKAIAHHDHVDHASLLIPGWVHMVELVNTAREIVEMLARAYVSVSFNLRYDSKRLSVSLRQLMDRAGLTDEKAGTE